MDHGLGSKMGHCINSHVFFFMLYNNNYYYNYNYYYYILLLFLIIIIILPAKIAVICHYHPLSLSTIFWKICAIGMIIHGTNE
jgi:hypothetical protein